MTDFSQTLIQKHYEYRSGALYRKGYKKSILHQGKINGQHCCVNRIVWILHNGPIPDGYLVAHIDNDASNNSIENLELRSSSLLISTNNRKKSNSSGYKHVYQVKVGKYWVKIFKDGKAHSSPIFDDLGNAIAFRDRLRISLFGEEVAARLG